MAAERPVEVCGECRWSRLVRAPGANRRECRFDAPRVLDVSGDGHWPRVNDGDWCRQWTPPWEITRGTMGRRMPADAAPLDEA